MRWNMATWMILGLGLSACAEVPDQAAGAIAGEELRDDTLRSPDGPAALAEVAGDIASVSRPTKIPAPREPPVGTAAGHVFLPVESVMLTDGKLNSSAMAAVRSADFDQVFSEFSAQNAMRGDPLGPAYRAALDRSLRHVDGASPVHRAVCATEICIATIRTADDEPWFEDWYDTVQFESELPMNTLVMHRAVLPDGTVEMRLLFTTGEHSIGGLIYGPG